MAVIDTETWRVLTALALGLTVGLIGGAAFAWGARRGSVEHHGYHHRKERDLQVGMDRWREVAAANEAEFRRLGSEREAFGRLIVSLRAREDVLVGEIDDLAAEVEVLRTELDLARSAPIPEMIEREVSLRNQVDELMARVQAAEGKLRTQPKYREVVLEAPEVRRIEGTTLVRLPKGGPAEVRALLEAPPIQQRPPAHVARSSHPQREPVAVPDRPDGAVSLPPGQGWEDGPDS